jgi:hypothetical protein
MWAKIVLF